MRQKSPNWGLVIAKNGGSFHTPDYIEALSDILDHPKVRLLILPKRGLGYALNEAFRHFNEGYKYFANLEDDDEWGEHFLTTMVKTLEKTDADVAHCQQRQTPTPIQSNGEPMDTDTLKRHNWINFPMCLFRSELVRKVDGFCNAAGPATDWDFHLRAVQAGARYVFVNKPMVTHHWHDDNYCVTHKRGGSIYVKEQIKGGHYD
jgi:GT2 family glycosyltransferase